MLSQMNQKKTGTECVRGAGAAGFPNHRWLTLPNLLSVIRLALIPVIIWLFVGRENRMAALAVIALSALTDIAYGIIARHCGQVSDVGKILNPVADKLTQGSIIVCLCFEHRQLIILLLLFAVKEVVVALFGWLTMKYAHYVSGARWYGKLCSVVMVAAVSAFVLFPGMKEWAVSAIMALCAAVLIFSMVMYLRYYTILLHGTVLQERFENQGHRWLNIATALIWVCIIVACIVNRDKLTFDGVLKYTPSDPALAAAVMLLLFALKSLSFFMYCGVLYAASGIIFPLPVAIAVNIAGTAIMVSIPYFLGRFQGEHALNRLSERFPRVKALRKLREKNDFMFTLILRLVGMLPSDAVSLYCGAGGVKYKRYLPACVIGFMPEIGTFPILGMNVSTPGSPEFLIALAVNASFMLGSLVTLIVMNRKRKKSERID